MIPRCHLLLLLLGLTTVNAPMNNLQASENSMTQQSTLHDAAARNDATAIGQLLQQGVDIEGRDNSGRTALLIATHHDAIDAARALIEAGADVNATDNIHDSPYLYAGAEGRLEILRMTLNHGADLASVNRYGGTALIPAAHHGHVETVRLLLTTDTDIDHVNRLGWTALLEAIILGDGSKTYVDIVQLLLEAGADVNLPDADNVSPLNHALSRHQTEIVELLRQAGAR